MKVKFMAGVALAALICAGQAQKAPAVSKAPAAVDPKEVVIAVGDAKLTRGELDAEVNKFIEMQTARMSPEQRKQMADQIERAKGQIAEQYKTQMVEGNYVVG